MRLCCNNLYFYFRVEDFDFLYNLLVFLLVYFFHFLIYHILKFCLYGLFLNLILPVIKNNKQVTILTENTKAFLSLSNKAQTLYGAEPVFADSLRESNGLDIVINLDTITDILRKSDITNDELLKDLDPLQLGSAFYLEKIDFFT